MTATQYCREQLGPEFAKLPMKDKQDCLTYAREEAAAIGLEFETAK